MRPTHLEGSKEYFKEPREAKDPQEQAIGNQDNPQIAETEEQALLLTSTP